MLQTLKLLPRILRNTLRINFLKFSGRLIFPLEILPKRNYKPVINISLLLENQSVFILRRSNSSFSDTFNELGYLRESALIPKEIPNLSLNLLGGKFKPKDACFRIINNGQKKWINNEPIFLCEYLKDFKKLDETCNIYLNANGIHRQQVPYTVPTNPHFKKEVDKFFEYVSKPIIEDDKFLLQGETNIQHDPTKLNYWHVEFNLIDFKGVALKYNNSTSIKDFCVKVLKDIICANSYNYLADPKPIPKKFYIK